MVKRMISISDGMICRTGCYDMCSIVIVFDAAYYYCEVCILLEDFVIISVPKVVSYPNLSFKGFAPLDNYRSHSVAISIFYRH